MFSFARIWQKTVSMYFSEIWIGPDALWQKISSELFRNFLLFKHERLLTLPSPLLCVIFNTYNFLWDLFRPFAYAHLFFFYNYVFAVSFHVIFETSMDDTFLPQKGRVRLTCLKVKFATYFKYWPHVKVILLKANPISWCFTDQNFFN